MSAPPPARALYLTGDEREPVFTLLHMPARAGRGRVAVLICPPFGWEDICSYRSRRDWAEQLALAGHPVLRIDLPGTGDSGGSPDGAGGLAAWVRAVGSAADWLRGTTGAPRVAAIGIGLGGLVACCAIGDGAPIDELVLWAVASRGQAFLRELRAFERMNASARAAREDHARSALADGDIEAGGFVLSADTAQEVARVDLATLPVAGSRLTRALLLERDGIAVDERLRHHLEAAGTNVTVAPGRGYAQMMAVPHEARSPQETFARTQAWLEDAAQTAGVWRQRSPRPALARAPRAIEERAVAELDVGGARVSETPLAIEQPFGRMFGVLVVPLNVPRLGVSAMLLNAGAIRRIGPNRMWVETARRWAARGVPTLRLDLEGIGDADGRADRFGELAEFYAPEMVDQALAALDALETRYVASPFVLAGLCSGACWSFHAALRDERVAAAFLLNPRTLFWDRTLNTARDFRRGVLRPRNWSRVLRGEVAPARIIELVSRAPYVLPKRALARWQRRRGRDDQLDRALDELRNADKRLRFMFTANEPLYEELEVEHRLRRLDRWPNVGFDLLPGFDHSLRPLESQRNAEAALDSALDAELRRAPDDSRGATTTRRPTLATFRSYE